MTPARLRTLLVVHDFPPMAGGIARAMGEIARHAPEGSLVVSTGHMPDSEAFDATCRSPVDRLPLAARRLRSLPGLGWWAGRAERLARAHRTAFVWAGNLKPAGYVARWLHARHGLPYGLIVYGFDVQRLASQATASPIKQRAARAILGRSAGTVAISAWTAARFRELACQLGLEGAAERVRVVRPGVDTRRFRPGLSTATVRERYGLDGRPWLLTVARLVPHKGIDVGIHVLRRLREEGIEAGYAVAGVGPERDALARLADASGLSAQVRFLGAVPDADLPALYNSATVYLGLSREQALEVEGFGLALLEAAACGLPVVAGQGGGTGEAVAAGITGYLVETASADAATSAVRHLLEDAAQARELGAAARARVEQEFTWGRAVGELEEAARGFSGGRGPPAGH